MVATFTQNMPEAQKNMWQRDCDNLFYIPPYLEKGKLCYHVVNYFVTGIPFFVGTIFA